MQIVQSQSMLDYQVCLVGGQILTTDLEIRTDALTTD